MRRMNELGTKGDRVGRKKKIEECEIYDWERMKRLLGIEQPSFERPSKDTTNGIDKTVNDSFAV